MLAQGTTTVEIKSGYGLSLADEERLVRLAAESLPR
jgi:imidazolonepropionase